MRTYHPDRTNPEKRETLWNHLFLWFVKLTAFPFVYLYFAFPRVICEGKRPKLTGKTAIVCNHKSTWDPVLINLVYPLHRIYFMAASVMFTYNRLFSWFLNQLGAFAVTRNKTDLGALGQAIDLLKNGKILGIFPEGRRSEGSEMLPFKPGAIMAALTTGATILPMCIYGGYTFLHRVTICIGQPIDLAQYCQDPRPSPEKLKDLCHMLENTVKQLQAKAEAAAAPKRRV